MRAADNDQGLLTMPGRLAVVRSTAAVKAQRISVRV